ncbi:MAG TPA: FAD-dependent oxidoreductase [Nitrososphaeraceae archaeon]|nr:FAD-dependent oxidoreductase [Nitrososphaeraceae archaeon]
MQTHYNVAIIGGGILGTSIAYFLSSICSLKVLLIEQEKKVAFHTSSRNTGRVHAPFLYDPAKKKLFAKAASLGYEMWYKYSNNKHLLFKQDGVLEVATDERGIDRLQKYIEWGESNGLKQELDLKFLKGSEIKNFEPSVRGTAALYCSKDASVDYGSLTKSLLQDCKSFGCSILLGYKVRKISRSTNDSTLTIAAVNDREEKRITTEFIVNAAGGNAMDIAHSMHLAKEFTDLHFRGEYWQAPVEYRHLTKLSIYSVPKYPEYPFLDPHWIVRIDGRCEVGPNAVPVFGPYAYDWSKNLRYILPKIFESSKTAGVCKILFDRQFLHLILDEFKSSLSKTSMINRAREFLPQLKASAFTERGTAGIRSLLIDKDGKFIPDTQIIKQDNSIHILNYNSPGATGALPMAASVVNELYEDGTISFAESKSLWDIRSVAEKMDLKIN